AAETATGEAPDLHTAEVRVETARNAVTQARGRMAEAEAHLNNATEAEMSAREPVDRLQSEVQRLGAEARALAELLRPATDLWPPLIDSLKVQPGYEAALAAALGDELNAPLDEAAPHHWRNLGALESAANLPLGIPLANFVEAPGALSRRLSFTGLVSVEEGKRGQKDLKPGQRLVSQRGDLWRWDGYSASADAPSQSAIRLEQRNRLDALERELASLKSE